MGMNVRANIWREIILKPMVSTLISNVESSVIMNGERIGQGITAKHEQVLYVFTENKGDTDNGSLRMEHFGKELI
jgi:hypothetical protein